MWVFICLKICYTLLGDNVAKRKIKLSKTKRLFRLLLVLACIGVILWFILVMHEVKRVKNDQKPLLCFRPKSDTEGVGEYSITCYGPLYKYKEYYMSDGDKLNAREFTLYFKTFKREAKSYEIG